MVYRNSQDSNSFGSSNQFPGHFFINIQQFPICVARLAFFVCPLVDQLKCNVWSKQLLIHPFLVMLNYKEINLERMYCRKRKCLHTETYVSDGIFDILKQQQQVISDVFNSNLVLTNMGCSLWWPTSKYKCCFLSYHFYWMAMDGVF